VDELHEVGVDVLSMGYIEPVTGGGVLVIEAVRDEFRDWPVRRRPPIRWHWTAQAGVPRRRRTARHRCTAGSNLAPDGWPQIVRLSDRAPVRPGTEADAGTSCPPEAVHAQIFLARMPWLLPWCIASGPAVAGTLLSCGHGDVETSAI